MQIRNSNDKYGIIAISFHWLMALLIIGLLILGLYMVDLPISLQKVKLYGLHKEFGILVLMLVVLRIIWRMSGIVPLLPAHMPKWQKLGARTSHFCLYLWMIAMPFTGWLSSSASGFSVSFFGLFILPDLVSPSQDVRLLLTEVHKLLGFAFIGLICLHVAGAFYHLIIFRDNIFKRIIP